MAITCICGKRFSSEAGHKTHIRRLRCRGPPREDSNQCPVCRSAWETYAGMRQHMRHAHPDEYNRELEERYEQPGTSAENEDAQGFGDEAYLRLARAEVAYEGRFVNKHLVALFPNWSLHTIKYRRSKPQYKELVEALAREANVVPPVDVVEEVEAEADAEVPDQGREPDVSLVIERSMSSSFLSGSRASAGVAPATLVCDPGSTSEPTGRQSGDDIRRYVGEYLATAEGVDDDDQVVLNLLSLPLNQQRREHVRQALEHYLSLKFYGAQPRTTARARAPFSSRRGQPTNASGRRAFLYRKVQEMYEKDRARLATCIIEDKPVVGDIDYPAVDEVDAEYRRIFAAPSRVRAPQWCG